MLRLALKNLAARKWRLLTTGIAIILGVTFVTGTLLLSTVLQKTVDNLVGTAYDGYDAVIRSPAPADGDQGSRSVRGLMPEKLLAQAKSVPEVASAVGLVADSAIAFDSRDRRIGGGFSAPTFATNWVDDPVLVPASFVQGRPPAGRGEVAIDTNTAKTQRLEVGDTLKVQFPAGPEPTAQSFRIVGIGGLGTDGQTTSGSILLIFDDETSLILTGRKPDPQAVPPVATGGTAADRGQYDWIALAAAPGVGQGELRDAVATAIGTRPGVEVVTGATFIADQRAQFSQFVGTLTTAVLAFGWVALFVGSFVIYNTFSILTAQRTREMALLRALGASRRQVLGSVLFEALGVGLVGGVIGLGLGTLLARVLTRLVSGTLPLSSAGLVPTPGIVAQALGVAVIVSVLSAVIPAYRSTRVAPVAAFGAVAVDRSALSTSRKIFGALFLLLGIGLVTAANMEAFDNPLPAIGIGAGFLFVAVVVIGPVFAAPLVRLIAAPLPRVFGTPGRLARDNAARNPKRTIATAVALTIGVAVITVIAVMAASIKGLLSDATVTGFAKIDAIVDSGDFVAGINPRTTETLKKLPEVGSLSSVRFAPVTLLDTPLSPGETPKVDPTKLPAGESEIVGGVDPAAYLSMVNLGTRTPADAVPGNDEVLVRAQQAEEKGWKIGDTLGVYSPISYATSGLQKWKIVGFFELQLGPQAYYVNLDTFGRNTLPAFNTDQAVYLTAAPGVSDGALRDALRGALKDSPAAGVSDVKAYLAKTTSFLDTVLAVIYGLLALAIIIAVVGIVNALSLAVLERTREIGLLRAVGMGRAQLRRSIRWESAAVSVLGALLGLVIGIALAVSFVYGLGESAIRPVMPWGTIVTVLILSVMAGIGAATLPAWRASRQDVLIAVSTE